MQLRGFIFLALQCFSIALQSFWALKLEFCTAKNKMCNATSRFLHCKVWFFALQSLVLCIAILSLFALQTLVFCIAKFGSRKGSRRGSEGVQRGLWQPSISSPPTMVLQGFPEGSRGVPRVLEGPRQGAGGVPMGSTELPRRRTVPDPLVADPLLCLSERGERALAAGG